VRAEYPLAVERLRKAIGQARERGLLGKNILGSGFRLRPGDPHGLRRVRVRRGDRADASIEGKRGEPRPRPPFPAQKGLWGKPTVLNNVETYANVPAILLNGAPGTPHGTEKSKGTKVFALAGASTTPGWSECPSACRWAR
jgi:NADH:ubiquinone oxidoreductase subunit F (NADH-binding)